MSFSLSALILNLSYLSNAFFVFYSFFSKCAFTAYANFLYLPLVCL